MSILPILRTLVIEANFTTSLALQKGVATLLEARRQLVVKIVLMTRPSKDELDGFLANMENYADRLTFHWDDKEHKQFISFEGDHSITGYNMLDYGVDWYKLWHRTQLMYRILNHKRFP